MAPYQTSHRSSEEIGTESLVNAFTDGGGHGGYESLKRVSDELKPLCAVKETSVDNVPEQFIICPETVYSKLEKINVHKAPGADGIPGLVLA